ncbi:MAG: hypothetical protein LH645_00210, partial [Actinomycetia bacterium]|nr:hypothetical protein [Actinomycetes bacterium]
MAAVVVAVLAVGLLPLALAAPSAARSARVIDGSAFGRSLSGWLGATGTTRPDQAATVGLTDAPPLVRSTQAEARYTATAWVRATSRAVRPGSVAVRLHLGELTKSGRGPTAWQGRRLSDQHWHKVSVP